ncbi:MAG: WcaI family glycosyltransferase [Verrucomicrobiota bacterium]
MKIIVWGINYAPEVVGIAPCNAAVCEFLERRGHEVRMITTFCYYPAWCKLPADEDLLYRTDILNGVPIHRCWHYVPRKVTSLRRVFHEASFVVTAFLRLMALPRPDVLVVVSPPLLLGVFAWFASVIKRCPYVFHVQDLQPDAAVGLKMVQSGLLLRGLYALETIAYRRAARVSGISQGMLQAFRRKHVAEHKILYFPNSISLTYDLDYPQEPGAFRRQHALSKDDFLVVYSGNLGVKQGLTLLLDCAAHLRDETIKLVLCGDGAMREALARQIKDRNLSQILLLPLQPEAKYVAMLRDANLCVITQQPGTGYAFFPSKLLPTLALGKPVLAVADGKSELFRVTQSGRFGITLATLDAATIAQTIMQLAKSPESLAGMAQAGCDYVRQFDRKTVLTAFEQELRSLCRFPETLKKNV